MVCDDLGSGSSSGISWSASCPRREMGGDSTCLGPCVLLADAECSYASFQDPWAALPWELCLFFSLELFSPPMLIASPSSPTEGSPVTLKCETWLPPQRSHIQLQFCFFREDKALGKCWSSSPELKLPTVWSEDAESYWCQAESVTPPIRKRSLRSQLYVQSEYLWSCSSRVRAGEMKAEQWHFLLPGTVNITKRRFLLSWYPSHFRFNTGLMSLEHSLPSNSVNSNCWSIAGSPVLWGWQSHTAYVLSRATDS